MSTLKIIRDFADPSLFYNKETACFIEGDRNVILSLTTLNCRGAVSFDWFDIWSKIKELEDYPDSFIMIHTHPPDIDRMSSIDRNMVQGWVQGLGREIWYSIICEGKFHLYHCYKDVDKKVKIDDLGFQDIAMEVEAGGLIGMVMAGNSKSKEDYDLDIVVQELNAVISKKEVEADAKS